MKITYPKEVPMDVKNLRKVKLQEYLTEFAKSDRSCMCIEIGDEYKDIKSAYGAWWIAIKRSGYAFRLYKDKKTNRLYLEKNL